MKSCGNGLCLTDVLTGDYIIWIIEAFLYGFTVTKVHVWDTVSVL